MFQAMGNNPHHSFQRHIILSIHLSHKSCIYRPGNSTSTKNCYRPIWFPFWPKLKWKGIFLKFLKTICTFMIRYTCSIPVLIDFWNLSKKNWLVLKKTCAYVNSIASLVESQFKEQVHLTHCECLCKFLWQSLRRLIVFFIESLNS